MPAMRILLAALMFAPSSALAQEVVDFAAAERVIAEAVALAGLTEESCGNLYYSQTIACMESELDDEAYYVMIGPIIDSQLAFTEAAVEVSEPHLGMDCGPVPVDATDEFGQTPLIYAIAADADRAVNFLLWSGSDVTHQTHAGWTPLMYAARSEAWGAWFIERLIEEGADPGISANDGTTALSLVHLNERILSSPSDLERMTDLLAAP